MSIVIRAYDVADWDAICRIHDAARLNELRGSVDLAAFLPLADTFEAEGLFDGDVWVAELDGLLAGFIGAGPDEITWLYVDPALTRRGVARALTTWVLDRAPAEVELEVLDGNTAARAFYESVGFVYRSTTTGKLVGNESYQVTGHTLGWNRGATL
jgi:ribosomal protein S18 acetylase RimI-like enzyme